MIKSIKITDSKKLPLRYADYIFKNGQIFEFKPGINIIVGENACGKSTLMKIIKKYLLCNEDIESNVSSINKLFEWKNGDFCNGAEVKADYDLKAFSLRTANEMDDNEKLGSFANFGLTYLSMNSSEGEKILQSMIHLFNRMFSQDEDNKFPIKQLNNTKEQSNEVYKRYAEQYLEYIEKNKIKDELKEYTIFMDEPDKNLSIKNLEQIYTVLSTHKEHAQIIAVIHNPVLIYSLSKNKDINFIEMSENYLEDVKKFVEKYTNKKFMSMTWNNWDNRPKDQAQIALGYWDWHDGWHFEIATYFQETDSILIDGEETHINWANDYFHSCWCALSNPDFKLRKNTV